MSAIGPVQQESYWKSRNPKLADVCINFLGWASIPLGLFLLFAVAKPFQAQCQVDVGLTVVGFIDFKLFLAQIIGAVVVLGLLAMIRTGAAPDNWQSIEKRAVAEFFSIFMNFGSLLLVTAIIFLYASIGESNQVALINERNVAKANSILGLVTLTVCWLCAPIHADNGEGRGGNAKERTKDPSPNPPEHQGNAQ